MNFSPKKLICSVLLLGVTLAANAHAKTCTPQEAEAADAATDDLDNWNKLNQTVKKFSHCDDGSIAEGNSEAVARLLIDKWQTLPELAKLIKRNPPLKKFVLRHINSTLDTDDLERIKKLAASSCPQKELYLLCSDINQAATRAAK